MTAHATIAAHDSPERAAIVRRGRRYSRVTLAYNALEGLAAITAGVMAGSIALIGFGADSAIEVVSSAASLWRLRADLEAERREAVERSALRIVGACFIALAVYILADAGHALWTRSVPETSLPGIIIAALSVVIMPVLARGKRRVARALGSKALEADATQTDLCMYLSASVLAGLVLNAAFGWWWADPVAALAMTPIIFREGLAGVRGEVSCDSCAPHSP